MTNETANEDPIKIFISQPMSRKGSEDILNERNRMIKFTEKNFGDVEIIDSFFEDFNDSKIKNPPIAYLGAAVSKMADADVAVFASGWKESRGCLIEHLTASLYEIPTMAFDEDGYWLDAPIFLHAALESGNPESIRAALKGGDPE